MLQFHDDRRQNHRLVSCSESVGRCAVSSIFVLLTHFALSVVARFFPASPLLLQLSFSGLVLLVVVGCGSCCRRLVGLYASASAFVYLNIIFVWGVYVAVVRKVVPSFIDAVFNGEVVMLFIGLNSILLSDPGFVTYGSSESDELVDSKAFGVEAHMEDSVLHKRVRYCKSCKAYVRGFDHHCPAFGNCIGQKNYALFMVLLVGFLATECSYVMCASQFVRGYLSSSGNRLENNLSGSLVISTMLFTLLQVLWQVIFFIWHIYCICYNITTDEWINWKKYPEFQLIFQSQQGESCTGMKFRNPYNKGILQNVKEFLGIKG